MKDIETKISSLISGMFPSFYKTDGPNFIAFVQAYYEWLEQNFQLLDLESVTNFNVGDTVQQADVTGTIYSVDNNSILVLVNGLETFKCFNVCSELIPVTSSSGGNTYILRGGTTRRLGSIFLSRNLSKIRDIDKTIDLFIVRFKEKYLKNIEFDTQTNKKLLIKNSLDLYRSKGTSRSIDLFFRLIYGVKSTVYYPGDDLFRLSDAEWFRPQYIEINSTSVDRAITLVGKQITGVNSGATAFVERYVKKKVNAGFVHAFYISSVKGVFEVNERVKYNEIFSDSPRIVGSFTSASIIEGSQDFNIGDLVDFESTTGLGGIGRVTSTTKGTGEVTFKLTDTGWGYTLNRTGQVYSYSSKTFLSDKILTLANVEVGQFVSNVSVVSGGLGYSNDDTITISSRYESATAKPSTNSTGGIVSAKVMTRGVGFFPDTDTHTVSVINSTSFPSTGNGHVFNVSYLYPKKYFEYLETIAQSQLTVYYGADVGIESFVPGSLLNINDINKYGTLLEIDTANNTMLINMLNNDYLVNGDVIFLVSNDACHVDVSSSVVTDAVAQVIYQDNTAIIEMGPPRGVFAVGDTIYQKDNENEVVASATITKTTGLSLSGGLINVSNLEGVFRANTNVFVVDKGTTANALFKTVTLSIAVANSVNIFVDSFTPFIRALTNGVKGYTLGVTSGSNAQYRIASLLDTQAVRLNNDKLTNTALLATKLNANSYFLPYSPTANVSSIIFSALDFIPVNIGSIASLGEINPGTGYNRDPIASLYQPYITGLQARDYIFTIANNQTSFSIGEYITQTNYSNNNLRVFVSNTQPYRFGEKVYAGNTTTNFIANGVINFINESSKYVELDFIAGTMPTTNNYNLKSLITVANSYITNAISFVSTVQAKGIVKQVDTNKVYVKRIQFENEFVTGNNITGSSTGTSALLVEIEIDPDSDPIGLNGKVNTKATTANGVISQLQIIDSGYGFSNDEELIFTTATDDRTGTINNIKGGVGTGTGFYRTAKGFVSDISKIHDGDYYQEYSYDIISRIPVDKYASMFKKVMHTAGTRFFGSVLVDSLANVSIIAANSMIDITDDSPYTIQDRSSIDVQDRTEFYIEIRD